MNVSKFLVDTRRSVVSSILKVTSENKSETLKEKPSLIYSPKWSGELYQMPLFLF
jgi:hypothetical protein